MQKEKAWNDKKIILLLNFTTNSHKFSFVQLLLLVFLVTFRFWFHFSYIPIYMVHMHVA